MPSNEDIEAQQVLLHNHRQTLRYLLQQRALHTSILAPPVVGHSITEARAHIRAIKATLQGWGISVDDAPEDQEIQYPDEPMTPAHRIQLEVLHPRQLRELLDRHFNLEELDLLCADVEADLVHNGVILRFNLEVVGGTSKLSKIHNLISYLDRRGYLDYLVLAVTRARPNLPI